MWVGGWGGAIMLSSYSCEEQTGLECTCNGWGGGGGGGDIHVQ